MPSNVSETVAPAVAKSTQSLRAMNGSALILVVDDNPNLRSMLENILDAWGYACIGASDGITALMHLSQYPITLVITDYQMPGIDGLELLKRLRVQHPSIPVIVCSGVVAPELAAQALSIGALAWLFKPMDIDGLRKIVRKAIQQSQVGDAE